MSTELQEVLDFGSPSVLEVPFTFNGLDYVLVEPFGDTIVAFQHAALKWQKAMDEKAPADLLGVQVSLLVGSLHSVNGDGRKKMTAEQIKAAIPNRVISKLSDKAREMAGIVGIDTVESLRQDIEKKTALLAKLEAGLQETPAKN